MRIVLDILQENKLFDFFSDDQHIKNDLLSSSNGGKDISPSCVNIHLNKLSQDEKIIIKKKVSRKNVLRIDSDNPPRSTKSYLMTIAASNFIEGKIPQDHPVNTKLGTDGSRKLVGMMQYVFVKNVDLYPINGSSLASTDDTILFIIPGKNGTHCRYNDMLVSPFHDNKTKIHYKKSCDDYDDENSKGMRVKLTFTFTAEGKMFNLYVTV